MALTTALVLLAASQGLPKSPAQPIKFCVQVLDSRTHQPLKSREVQVTFFEDRQGFRYALTIKGHTRSDGVVFFEVNRPIAPFMNIFVRWTLECSKQEQYSSQEALKEGVIMPWHSFGIKKVDKWCTPDSQVPQPRQQPGKVIVFVHPMNRFVWTWYAFWEE